MPTEIKMPQLGESVVEGTVSKWLKQPGDRVDAYEPLLEVMTDKVDSEIPAPVAGVLREIKVSEGTTVRVGTPLAILEIEGDAPEAGQASDGEPAAGGANPLGAALAAAFAPPAVSRAGPPLSPVVARLAAEHSIDLSQISGTGQGGRITKQDVLRYLERRAADASPPEGARSDGALLSAAPAKLTEEPALQESASSGPPAPAHAAPPAPAHAPPRPPAHDALPDDAEILPISPLRRMIAEHMVRSRSVAPHVTTVVEVDVSRIVAHRSRARDDFERQGVKLTFTPYFVQASVAALLAVPVFNGSYSDAGIIQHRRINIGVAVALDEGLIVPVIRDADEKNLLGLSRAVNDLAERARVRRLKPDETQGGTFTITNHGVSGSLFATPIINQPQSGILGVGAIQKRAVVISQNGTDAIAIRPMCYLSLTFDHRIADGATADRFLMTIKDYLERYE